MFLHAVLAVVLGGCVVGVHSRSVTVNVKAHWEQHHLSFLAEISEFIHDQYPASFWTFLNTMCTHSTSISASLSPTTEHGTDQETAVEALALLRTVALEATNTLVPSSMQTLMSTMLTLGHYQPALQFYESLAAPVATEAAERCGVNAAAFAVLSQSGKIVCSPDELTKALASITHDANLTAHGDIVAAEWEHVYAVERAHPLAGETAVLYGVLGSPAFCSLHSKLSSAAQEGSVAQYSVRHHFPRAASVGSGEGAAAKGVGLQGYGVLLDIKNMEYKNVDDTNTAAQGDGASTVDHTAADWDTLGLNFATLFEHVPASAHPGQTQDEVVTMLREQLTQALGADSGEGSTLKVWKMQDLGLQTLQLVRTAANQGTVSTAMARLAQIVHNFPQMAGMVSSTKVAAAVREEVQSHVGSFGGHMAVLPPNSLLINGRRTDLSAATFNIYNVLKEVGEELAVTSQLSAMNLTSEVKAQVQHVASTVGGPSAANPAKQAKQVRIDVSKGGKHVVHFLNNLEKDPQYQHLPRQLKNLLRPSWTLTALARNLYTLIVVVDPVTPEGAGMLMQMYMMLQQQYPVRCGMVFSCSASGGGSSGQPSAQEDFCRLFAQMRAKHSGEYATSFALGVAQTLLEGATQTLDRQQMSEIYIGTVEGMAESESQQASWLGGGSSKSVAAAKKAAVGEVEAVFPAAVTDDTPKSQLLHWDFVSNSSSYLAARNLPLNSYSLNGIVVGSDGSGGANLGGTIMQHLGREQQHITSLYQRKVITDKTKSLFGAILSASNAYSRYHPMLDETKPDYATLSPEAVERVNWVEPWPQAGSAQVASSTLLRAPLTAQGLQAASTLLQWAVNANAATLEGSLEGAPTRSDGGEGAAVPPAMQRVAVVWDLAIQSDGNTCLEGGADATTCSAPLKGAKEGAVLAVLIELQADLSVSLSGDAAQCDSICTSLMAKAFHLAADVIATRPTVAAIRTGLRMSLLGTLASLSAGPAHDAPKRVEEVRSVLERLVAGHSETDAVAAAIATTESLARLVDTALRPAPTVEPVTVLHNGRKLVLSAPAQAAEGAVPEGILMEEDLVLLATLEAGRIGDSLLPIVRSLVPTGAKTGDGAVAVMRSSRHHSDLLLQLASYCGAFNSGTQKYRFDVTTALDQVAALNAAMNTGAPSAMLYTVEPPVSAFATAAASDLQVVITVDPLSLAGQRAAALIPLLSEQLQYTVTVLLVPRLEMSDFPLQNFYRYVTAGATGADAASEADAQPAARFASLPRQHVLTVRMDVPEPWNVQTASAIQDTDNLRCSPGHCGDPHSTRPKHTAVTYALKNLLVAGQCFEGATPATAMSRYAVPPNGLQLTLTSAQLASANKAGAALPQHYSDTLVMQNLGYFQLQAHPGLFALGTAQGRASDLYALHSDQSNVRDGVMYVPVRSFEDVVHRLLVHKRPGMEEMSLLGDDTDSEGTDAGAPQTGGRDRSARAATMRALERKKKLDAAKAEKAEQAKKGLWGSLSSSLFGTAETGKEGVSTEVTVDSSGESTSAGEAPVPSLEAGGADEGQDSQLAVAGDQEEDDTIHVFSLATGHMYERLLRIMMLSVTRHSSRPVKFWLFENYLSPTFKASAAVMAEEYGFQVAYVTYKWPQWLTQQTQQQRIIWGYKILFLDVLFPLNVKKVIYVDADQVVRADLAELWDLDLQGHAYAYTPFCTSREETLGFQFWQQGYWKDHLRGRPYHISALYVVDLQRFRRHAVGDTLRAIYDQLSRDPNSLANLDQDLPNYAQHQVPIFSLPQDWLWCESWCSDESKSTAKTIDLCNNPLYKEPKLDMARRVISGELFNQSWVSLDDEIRSLQARKGLVLSQQ